jgi:tetratricopeptide (TPR) repeat protein
MDLAFENVSAEPPREAQLITLVHNFDKTGRLEATLGEWAKYQASYPRYFLAHLLVAFFLTNNGKPSERVQRFDDALAIDGRHAITYIAKSYLHLRLGQVREAREAVDTGLKKRATSWLVAQRGVTNMAAGDYPAATKDLFEALKHDHPFMVGVNYALALLGSRDPADELKRRGEVAVLSQTKNLDERMVFLCNHGLALLRVGRTTEGDTMLEDGMKLAKREPKHGTLIRCALSPAWFNVAIGRFDKAKKLVQRMQGALSGVVTTVPADEVLGRKLGTELDGIIAAEQAQIDAAEEALRHMEAAGEDPEDLRWHVALAKKLPTEVSEPKSDNLLARARYHHISARMLELAGRTAEAEASYARLLDLQRDCANSERSADFACGGYVADGLVRLAELQDKRRDADGVRKALAAFDAFWPRPDADLAIVHRAAALRARFRR